MVLLLIALLQLIIYNNIVETLKELVEELKRDNKEVDDKIVKAIREHEIHYDDKISKIIADHEMRYHNHN